MTDNEVVLRVVYPIEPFTERITKKGFGQFIIPETSPVQPERFSGYHTGIDLEVIDDEQETDVPVYAIADGAIVFLSNVNGYGGVLMTQHEIDGETITVLFGHIRLSSVEQAIGDTINMGEQIAVLGTGGTVETDGERKHLHFSLMKGEGTDVRGYVQSKQELSSWFDPEVWLENIE